MSLKYRDVPIIIQNIFMVLFFLTPIIWEARVFGNNSLFVYFNPFFHMIEVFRAPIVKNEIPWSSITFLTVFTVITFLCNAFIYQRKISKLGNWL